MSNVASKVVNTMAAFGASCVAPSVQTLNAVSGAMTIVVGLGAVTVGVAATKPIRNKISTKIGEQMEKSEAGKAAKEKFHKITNSWLGRNFVKASVIGAAVIVGTPMAWQTYNDMAHNDEEFSVALRDNVLRPTYSIARYGVKEGLVPLGRWTTEKINNGITAAFEIETPEMAHDPVFNSHSSFRGRCIEPMAKMLLDGNVFILDNIIRGAPTPPKGIDREMLDSYTESKVYYHAEPICD